MAGRVQEGWQASGYVSVFFFLLGVSVGVIWPKSWQLYHSALLFALVKQACLSRISIPTVSYYYTTLYSVHTKKKRRSVKCFFFFIYFLYFFGKGGKENSVLLSFVQEYFFIFPSWALLCWPLSRYIYSRVPTVISFFLFRSWNDYNFEHRLQRSCSYTSLIFIYYYYFFFLEDKIFELPSFYFFVIYFCRCRPFFRGGGKSYKLFELSFELSVMTSSVVPARSARQLIGPLFFYVLGGGRIHVIYRDFLLCLVVARSTFSFYYHHPFSAVPGDPCRV